MIHYIDTLRKCTSIASFAHQSTFTIKINLMFTTEVTIISVMSAKSWAKESSLKKDRQTCLNLKSTETKTSFGSTIEKIITYAIIKSAQCLYSKMESS